MKKISLLLVVSGAFLSLVAWAAPEETTDDRPGFASSPAPAPEETNSRPWFRDDGDYVAFRALRSLPTDPTLKLLSDGKRFDTTVGKRIPLLTWGEEGTGSASTLGIDAGMLASLVRYDQGGRFTFATNTFDGFFGLFLGRGWENGWLALFRAAHLSAHLVDNSPQVSSAVPYSHFWNEIVVGKTFPEPGQESNWDLHLQGSVGLNHTSVPKYKQPRAALGATFSHSLAGPGSFALITSVDALRAGVTDQKPSYMAFLGIGTLNRRGLRQRPYRTGIAFFHGSDYRNQFYNRRHKWITFELSVEL